MTIHREYDILGLGCCAVDEMIFVPTYPAADSKMKVTRRKTQLGGLAGSALIAASRLSGRCAYAGRLGFDAASKFTATTLAAEGIDVAHVPYESDALVIQSTIIVAEDTGGRNIFFSCDGKIGAHPELPSERVIQTSRVLLLDYFGMDGNIRAAKLARASGIPIVADFEDNSVPRFDELLDLIDHPILSADTARRITGLNDPARAVAAIWKDSRSAAIVTCGAEGCWVVCTESKQPRHYPAFSVSAIDTTGCGDVFHGAYALALAQGMPLADRIRFASAAAAIKASRNQPIDLAAVQQLIQSQPVHIQK